MLESLLGEKSDPEAKPTKSRHELAARRPEAKAPQRWLRG
jgi:hypothetical protein